jgi:hypothetical protein
MKAADIAPCPGGAPRVKDVALAPVLGFCPAGAIRVFIQQHRRTLLAYGDLFLEQERPLEPPLRAGRPVSAYWLTEDQALALATLTRSLDQPEMRRAIERGFAAYHGKPARDVVRVTAMAEPDVAPPASAPVAAPGAAPAEPAIGAVALLGLLREWPDGARIQDLKLGELLGFGRAREIRPLIERNSERLEQDGEVCGTVPQTSAKGGRPATEYWLNKRQALRLCMWARTDKADAAQSALLDAWDAWEAQRQGAPSTELAQLRTDMAALAGQMVQMQQLLARLMKGASP